VWHSDRGCERPWVLSSAPKNKTNKQTKSAKYCFTDSFWFEDMVMQGIYYCSLITSQFKVLYGK
jgi:hypothetical protein